eukprot:GEMP01002155.1.p1 GENE.GEMP01002155.1~~GEMP01002155.1.p1  ORF type:complete len:662 (+),score=169.20 GEMP01002155.1:52-1986(+)
MEEQLHSLRTEWNILKEKWFIGEKMDPVFEGTIRDFCQFDNTLQDIYKNVEVFMKGVEQLCEGVSTLSESVVQGLGHYHDGHIATESCKLRAACHQITRVDAPHSAIAKLRRDMDFNILNPMRTHLLNNRNLKTNLDVRRRRLLELTSAKKPFDILVQKNVAPTDPKYLRAKSHYESAKFSFQECDRQVFEWLYILEDYKGDILDSTLQTLKYLQYEFFASAAHSISGALPARMEFRPMVEMTPDHLEAQVELELKEQDEQEGSSDKEKEPVTDFSIRLIEKMVKQSPPEPPAVAVDPLSLASLVGQGFEEGPARRGLRMHKNDTQKALDWLVHGGTEQKRENGDADGVRQPTTIKRIQKLRARRKKIAAEKERKRQLDKEKAAEMEKEEEEDRAKKRKKKKKKKAVDSDDSPSESSDSNEPRRGSQKLPQHKSAPAAMDLIGLDEEPSVTAPAAASTAAPIRLNDLLSLDEPPPPTDFSKVMNVTMLPPQIPSFDPKCVATSTASANNSGTRLTSDAQNVLSMLQKGQQLSPQQLLLAQQLLSQQASAQQPPQPPVINLHSSALASQTSAPTSSPMIPMMEMNATATASSVAVPDNNFSSLLPLSPALVSVDGGANAAQVAAQNPIPNDGKNNPFEGLNDLLL